jgi:hypothetical protein
MIKKKSYEYTIKLNSKQVEVLRRACEVLARVHMCQFDIVIDEVMLNSKNYNKRKEILKDDFYCKNEEIRDLAKQLKVLLEPELPGSCYHGIGSKEISDHAAIAYDIQQVLRHTQSWKEYPPETTKCFLPITYDMPLAFSKEPLPKIEIDEE